MIGLAEALSCSIDWLLTGIGWVDKQAEEPKVIPEGEAPVFIKASDLPEIEIPNWIEPDPESYKPVPFVKSILNEDRDGFILSDAIKYFLSFRKEWLDQVATDPKNLVLIQMPGSGMEPEIKEGDILLVDKGRRDIRDGSLYALRHDRELSIKRILLLPNKMVRISSDNPKYPIEDISIDELHVVGQVLCHFRQYLTKGENEY